ncbi:MULTISPECIES: Gfo/Idh/MocA family oxidoreductase [Rhodopseudomonas]|uniref:Uncharacterized protein n=1 Tax=Rhodopseudomonas palustris TaxID=1076 RepID=A0A0D7EDX8_RHOPL|nr:MULTISPECIES: Gfo/Idh/MocA family oxidoreductase [Rhodopseudomonas]KIZ38836.1 hypothetical protein OO17_22415 [Rhodopseudomonas palustris]MDF3808918.1 Gfo/Idh/MocA family oxidoreductase [Rhodopseudomonas sp. BAL398]WOK18373.1 Gfo/Idh/MocA family oxidoreductase [Rhodopseudomonas sp. BAL398]
MMTASAPRLGLGICGCGWVVRSCYRPALAQCEALFAVVAVYDPQPEALRFAAQAWPAAKLCASRDALLAQRLDAVLVASPNARHLDDAVAALDAGISCLVEKPVVRGVHDAARLRAATRPSARLVSGVACRFRDDTQLWLDHVGQIGALRELDLLWSREHGVPAANWHLKRDHGWTGVFADLGYHLLDIAGAALHWRLAPLELLEASRTSRRSGGGAGWYKRQGEAELVQYDTDDHFDATLRLGDCRIRLRVSWIDDQPGDLVRLAARGPSGEAVLSGLFGFSDNRRDPDQQVMLRRDGEPFRRADFAPGPGLQLTAFEHLLGHFHRSVMGQIADQSDELLFVATLAGAMQAGAS